MLALAQGGVQVHDEEVSSEPRRDQCCVGTVCIDRADDAVTQVMDRVTDASGPAVNPPMTLCVCHSVTSFACTSPTM